MRLAGSTHSDRLVPFHPSLLPFLPSSSPSPSLSLSPLLPSSSSSCTGFHPYLSRRNLKLATWSCNSLFGTAWSAEHSSRKSFKFLSRILDSHDIVFLQETHGNIADLGVLIRKFPGFDFFGSFSGNPASGGVVICLARSVRSEFDSCHCVWLQPERILVVSLLSSEGLMCFCCIHLIQSMSIDCKHRILKSILNMCPSCLVGSYFLGGD